MASYENDYIKRMIETIGKGIAKAIMGKDMVMDNENEDDEAGIVLSEEELVELRIRKYIRENEINMAENVLLEAIEKNRSLKYLKIATDFYSDLNRFSEEKLESCNYSRQEIVEGLEQIQKIYT